MWLETDNNARSRVRSARIRPVVVLSLAVLWALVAAACTTGNEPEAQPSTSSTSGDTSETASSELASTDPGDESTTSTTSEPEQTTTTKEPEPSFYFETLPPGSALPDGETCAEQVRADPSTENRPENESMNNQVVEASVEIDGADKFWNDAFAPRITGDFTGTTEQILRWGACKWGFDEDITRARAVTESSWRSGTEGDGSEDPAECALIGMEAPCAQSYGILQVKGTIHLGTHPASTQSTAFGVDYAMAWLRACFEGSFIWLQTDGRPPYEVGNELGCVGAWFSGEWWDQLANDYVGEVRFHVEARTWETY